MAHATGVIYRPEERAEKMRQMDIWLRAGVPKGEVAKRLEVTPSTLYNWQQELRADMTAAMIAGKIRQELVCPCGSYDKLAPLRKLRHGDDGYEEGRKLWQETMDGHSICYWGEAAALIADSFKAT